MDKNALYYTAPYQKEFDAEVLSCTEKAGQYLIVLDRNGFYPEGGGQPSDTGRIVVTGTVKSRGSRTALAEAHLTDPDGRLLAHATSTCLLFHIAS